MVMVVASAMKVGQGRQSGDSVRPVMVMCIVVVVLALGMSGMCTANAGGDQAGHDGKQTTHKSSAKTLAYGRQLSYFECPCSNQYCDYNKWDYCLCDVSTCSTCLCHNSAQTKVPGLGATAQLLAKP